MASLDGFGNLICFEINVLGRKNAVITYDSTILSVVVKYYRCITIHDQLFLCSCLELLRIRQRMTVTILLPKRTC